MNDINTVTLSGTVASEVENTNAKGLSVTRFYIDVEGGCDKTPYGNFKVVAFAEQADNAKELSEGDCVVIVGALLDRRGRGTREIEIRIRNLIRLPKEEMPGSSAEKEEENNDESTEFEIIPVQ